ncbi:NINE protein [Intrasporangium sp. DVR]|uniref:NINE protein n=1 Tax=Intrasporangium sp. DVR TaxID=3127867 RepID=UPI0033411085
MVPGPEGKPMSRYWDGASWTEQLAPLATAAPGQLGTHYAVDATGMPVSPSSRLAATLLCAFLGPLGVHRFYVGKIGTGLVQLLTAGGLGIWWLIDLVMVIVGAFRDKEGRPLINW